MNNDMKHKLLKRTYRAISSDRAEYISIAAPMAYLALGTVQHVETSSEKAHGRRAGGGKRRHIFKVSLYTATSLTVLQITFR